MSKRKVKTRHTIRIVTRYPLKDIKVADLVRHLGLTRQEAARLRGIWGHLARKAQEPIELEPAPLGKMFAPLPLGRDEQAVWNVRKKAVEVVPFDGTYGTLRREEALHPKWGPTPLEALLDRTITQMEFTVIRPVIFSRVLIAGGSR